MKRLLVRWNLLAFRACVISTNLLLAGLVLNNLAEMTARGFFGRSLDWVFEINVLLAVWLYFLGIYQVYFKRGDIAVEVGSFVAATGSTPVSAELDELTGDVFVPGRPLLDVVARLSTRIHTALEFDSAVSDVSTPLAEVLRARRGVCQDFAHLMLAALRGRGLAGRYVSGYLETVPPPGQPKLAGTDASHAWCGVWDPVLGWFDVDPTNDQLPPRRHVTCAWGRDYFDVAPVRGVVIGPMAPQTLHVGVDVTALPTRS